VEKENLSGAEVEAIVSGAKIPETSGTEATAP
jgi:hypothetical protein